jgi:8-amino-7-oxononanoate synthase
MKKLPKLLTQKMQLREQNNALRKLPVSNNLIDFASNDYLGFANSEEIFNQTHDYLLENNIKINGATGSRLISGNHNLYQKTEDFIANFHQSETALIFNSGYDANVGFFSSVPQRNDIILYDELCHASIRDGIQMSNAKSYKFQHNDFNHLEKVIISQLETRNPKPETFYVVTESVFSMDGDSPNLEELVNLCEKYNCYLVIDEAHALGVFGDLGEGLIQYQGLQDKVFARIITFGKGLGCHGAAILGSQELKTYLVNFARSFIYTTGLSPHSVATILIAYQYLKSEKEAIQKLKNNKAPVVKVEEVTQTKVVSIQERIAEKTREYIGEIEGSIDECFVNRNFKTTFKPYELMKTLDIKGAHTRFIIPVFSNKLTEIEEALKGKDKDLVDGYSYLKKTELKEYANLLKTIIDDCTKIAHTSKVTRAPRKKKAKPVDKIIEKLQFKKEDNEYKVASINPADIIGSSQLWVFNTKTRKLGCYNATDAGGLNVKGTTLINYNEETSVQKTIRKPEVVLPATLKAGKIALRKTLTDINAVEQALTGRINSDIILLRVIK